MPARNTGGGRSSGGSKGGGRPSSGKTQGYTLRGPNGKINYVGTTSDPNRRAGEHKADGKPGKLKTETKPMPQKAAENWESNRLETYRDNHAGKNPRYNKTKNG